MIFNSKSFLLFLPIFLIIIFQLRGNQQRIFLLISSYVFYMWHVPVYGVLLVYSTFVTFFSIAFNKRRNPIPRGGWLFWLPICLLLFPLFVFKYSHFLLTELLFFSSLQSDEYSLFSQLVLPVGISFFTFQAISLFVDETRKRTPSKYKILDVALYISFFPQLVAGPIERAKDLVPQLRTNFVPVLSNLLPGLTLFILGLFKKVVVADTLNPFVGEIFLNHWSYAGEVLALAVFLFGIEIYCDFAGYTFMALGIARMLGIKLSLNFFNPYGSRNPQEFWKRWHITLSAWFRDYLYIPLGGNKNKNLSLIFLILFVFGVSGFWHGANWTYVIWGLIHGFGVVFYLLIKKIKLDVDAPLLWRVINFFGFTVTTLMVFWSWIFFRSNTVEDAVQYTTNLISGNVLAIFSIDFWDKTIPLSGTPSVNFIFAITVAALIFIRQVMLRNISTLEWVDRLSNRSAVAVTYILCVSIMFFGNMSNQTFIYFQF